MNEAQMELEVAERQFMRAAIRALLWTHPNPALLRPAWDFFVSSAWRDLALCGIPMTDSLKETMRKVQETTETYLPDISGPNSTGKVPPP